MSKWQIGTAAIANRCDLKSQSVDEIATKIASIYLWEIATEIAVIRSAAISNRCDFSQERHVERSISQARAPVGKNCEACGRNRCDSTSLADWILKLASKVERGSLASTTSAETHADTSG